MTSICRRAPLLFLFVFLTGASAFAASEPATLTIAAEPLGDAGQTVATRLTFSWSGTPSERPFIVQGSIMSNGSVLTTFRRQPSSPRETSVSAVERLPVGSATVEARLILESESGTPLMVAKAVRELGVQLTGTEFIAGDAASADAIYAEGLLPAAAGTIRILPPRRDVAPNLFIVEAQTEGTIRKVEFYVNDKKLLTRNRPPYRTEIDAGAIPRGTELRVVGYDAAGRYVDADAWLLNERENPLEARITRTETSDGLSHIKVSVQNPSSRRIVSVTLFAGDRQIAKWDKPPFATAVSSKHLAGAEFLRASVLDETNYEASDLLYLDSSRYVEQIDINLVELPVTVTDASGNSVTTLARDAFTVRENGRPVALSSFSVSSDVPLSVGVLIDHSGSMKPRIVPAREAAIRFFRDVLTPRDRGFFGGFSWQTTNLTPFVSTATTLEQQLATMPEPEGGTALYDAIVSGLYRFRSVSGRKALIIITDGEDTVSRVSYDRMLEYVRAARVPLYFVGVGISRLDVGAMSKLKSLAAETGGLTYFVDDAKQLDAIYEKLEAELRTQYVLGYQAEIGSTDRAYRRIDVTVPDKKLRVRTIRGFTP